MLIHSTYYKTSQCALSILLEGLSRFLTRCAVGTHMRGRKLAARKIDAETG